MASRFRLPTARRAPRSLSSQRSLVLNPPEILVGLNFRYWLHGYETGDISYWERAWTMSVDVLGPDRGPGLGADFSRWVKTLRQRSVRSLKALPDDRRTFGPDECVAMALVAAFQHQSCPALQACALSLLGCEPNSDVTAGSEHLARQLRNADLMLDPGSLDHVVRYSRGSESQRASLS